MRKRCFGLIAEYVAIIAYKLKFYQILSHRRRRYVGEIDIIALRGKQLVFVEVKGRSSSFDEMILTVNQQKRL